MKTKRTPHRVALLVMATTATGLWADEGRIPLYQPTMITQSGHYVVTQDISSAAGVILDIQDAMSREELSVFAKCIPRDGTKPSHRCFQKVFRVPAFKQSSKCYRWTCDGASGFFQDMKCLSPSRCSKEVTRELKAVVMIHKESQHICRR